MNSLRASLGLALLFLLTSASNAQITRVSQLQDIKPTDIFYSDLQNLVEKYNVINNDLIVVADDTVPRPVKISIGDTFYPKTPLTNRQLAFILDAATSRLEEALGGLAVPDHLDELGKYSFYRKVQGLLNKKPMNGLSKPSPKDIKGLNPVFEEYSSLTHLIERSGIGPDLIERDLSYNRTKTYSEKAITNILGNYLGIAPECSKGKLRVCKVGTLVINYRNPKVDRARFAIILNQYLEAFVRKADQFTASYNK